MRKILLLISILLSTCSLSAQQLEGTYINGSDSIAFVNDKVTFRITGFAGLSVAQVGEGSHEMVDNFLLVHTDDYSGLKSAYQALEGSRKDTCVVKVVGIQNYPLQTVLVESRNKSKKLIRSKVTDSEGKIYFTDNEKIVFITVSAMGYNALSFKYEPGKDFLAKLAENDIIEQRTVVFKMDIIDDETISLLLLTDDFETGKNRSNELKKMEKRARKSNLLDKRFKKVYVPYQRKI